MKKVIHAIVLVLALLPLTALAHGSHTIVANMPLHLHIGMHISDYIIYLPILAIFVLFLVKVAK